MRNKIKECFEKAHVPHDDRHKYLFRLLVDLFEEGATSNQNKQPLEANSSIEQGNDVTSDNNSEAKSLATLSSGLGNANEHIWKNRYEAMKEHLESQVQTIVQLKADNKTLRELLNSDKNVQASVATDGE